MLTVQTKNVFRLVSFKNVRTKSGDKELSFVTLSDKVTYGSNEFLLSDKTDRAKISAGIDCNAIFHFDARYVSVEISPA